MYSLGRRASFWVAAAVAGVALWTSGAPAVTYPLYAERWHLTATVTTAIFAVYPVALVVLLILAGDLSDHIGRRAAILLGLLMALLGSVCFAIAPSVGYLFVGRAFMGIGVGLSMSPATAAMVEYGSAGQAKRASSVTTASTALGLVLATVVGGGLIQYAPFPIHLNFWVLTIVVAVVLLAAWFMPRDSPTDAQEAWRPRLPVIAPRLRSVFATAALAVTAAYVTGAVMLSLGADIAKDLIHSGNALINGSVIAVFATVIAVVALVGKNLTVRSAVVFGGTSTATAMGLLTLAANYHSLPVLVAASIVNGIGYSLLFLGGLSLITAKAAQQHRAGTLSGIYLLAYLMQGVIAIVMGILATAHGLRFAIDIGAIVVAAFGISAVVLTLATERRPSVQPPRHGHLPAPHDLQAGNRPGR
jgi:MFS family permease